MQVGINLAGGTFYDCSNQFTSDLMKHCSGWISFKQNPPMLPDGYPSYVNEDTGPCWVILGLKAFMKKGRYTFTAEGKGKLKLPFKWTDQPQGWKELDFDGVNNQPYFIDCPKDFISDGDLNMQLFESDASNPIRNIKFLLPDASNTHPYNKAFIDNCSNFSHLRFMGWTNTNYTNQVKWSDRDESSFTYGNRNTVDFETICDICNITRKGCWINIPHMADDDYIHNLSALIDNKLDYDLPVFIEYSNEIWNWGFQQSQALLKQFNEMDKPSGFGIWEYHGKKSAYAVNLFKSGLKAKRKCIRMYCCQATWVGAGQEALAYIKDQTEGIDAVGIAPYFDYDYHQANRLPGILAQYNKGQKAEAVTKMLSMCHISIDEVSDIIKQYKKLCDQHGYHLTFYECGQGFCTPENDEYTQMFMDCNRDVRMGSILYKEYIDKMTANGAELAMFLNDCATWSKWGYWGHKENIGTPNSEAAKWRKILQAAWAGKIDKTF